jgi:cytochrome c oxidase subunit II
MLFNVKVVDQATYDKHISDLKAQGNTGQLDNSLNPAKVMDEDQHLIPSGGSS